MIKTYKYIVKLSSAFFLPALLVLIMLGFAGATSSQKVQAQGLIDGFLRGAGNADVTFSSTFESGDEFWNGETKTDVPPFYGTISRTTLSLYIAYGITDNLDVNLNLPYIFANGDGEGPASELPPQDFDALQDGQLTIKWRPFHAQAGPGTINLLAAGALAVPLSDYENGALPDANKKPILVAIGDRATSVSGELLAQYKFYSGVFTSVQGGYSIKGKTGDLDVPNAALVAGKLGYAGRWFYGAAWISSQFSTDGTDIGSAPFPPFPTNQVDFTRLGLTASVPVIPELSVDASAFTTLDGRNVTDTNAISVGITYKIGH